MNIYKFYVDIIQFPHLVKYVHADKFGNIVIDID